MTWLDQARGAYVRSPKFVRQSLRPILGIVPAQLKFGGTYRRFRHDIDRAAADPVFASTMHLSLLRRLLGKAHAGSSFYKRMIDQAFGPAFDPSSFVLKDLRHLPILDKKALREAGEAALAVPRGQVDASKTSGSNAEPPFEFFLDKDRSAREMAFVYDVWSRIGFSEHQSRVCFRGFNLDPGGKMIHDWDPALRELKLSVFPMTIEDASLYLDLIDARGIRFIYGYASAIELFCRQMQVLGRTPRLPIKGVMPISEPIFEHQRQYICDILVNPHFACFYGLSEKVLFAAEDPQTPGTYVFNPLYGLAELVDENGQAITEPGQEGRLVGTGFLSTGMPFVRYETGDFARLVELPTPQNGQRLVVCDLTPRRKPNFLVAEDGSRVVTTDLTPENAFFFNGIAEFQFYQDQPGDVLIRYIPGSGGTPEDAERMAGLMARRCHYRLRFQTQAVAKIATGQHGKRAFIDQRLDLRR